MPGTRIARPPPATIDLITNPAIHDPHDRTLLGQLRWFIALRWLAGVGTCAVAAGDRLLLHWSSSPQWIAVIGVVIITYNAALWFLMRRGRSQRPGLGTLAWAQVALDLACLTLLMLLSGGVQSPMLGFFVFHMVFASLLLSRTAAYTAAILAIAMVTIGLSATSRWPTEPAGRLALAGWVVMLLMTVYLANHIVRRLRTHQNRLVAQNRRIARMSRRLRDQQKAMIQQEKMAALGQMAAGVAHEIANPLANMDGLLQLMQRHADRVTPERLDTLRAQIERIRQTVGHMTEFAHPTELRWTDMPLVDVVEAGLEMLRYDRRQKQIEVRREFSPGGCRVRVQPHAMQQVLVNVLLNALDAVAEVNEPCITVSTVCSAETCSVVVADNGPGIPPEHMDHVFEPFFTTKPVGQGTGLGLAISYSLIRNQGGRIEIDSSPEHGTKVRLMLLRHEPGKCACPVDDDCGG